MTIKDGLVPTVYIFYGNSKIGKTTIANAINEDLHFIKHDFKDTSVEDIKASIKDDFCVIVDNISSREAIEMARYLSNEGIRCVLTEFKVFA